MCLTSLADSQLEMSGLPPPIAHRRTCDKVDYVNKKNVTMETLHYNTESLSLVKNNAFRTVLYEGWYFIHPWKAL